MITENTVCPRAVSRDFMFLIATQQLTTAKIEAEKKASSLEFTVATLETQNAAVWCY